MAKISNTTVYPNITPNLDDFVILTDVSDDDSTKTCTLNELSALFGVKTLVRTLKSSEVLNSFTNPIVLVTCLPGEYIQIIRSLYFVDFNTTPYVVPAPASSGLLLTNNGTSTDIAGVLPKSSLESSIDVVGSFSGNGEENTYPISGGGNTLTCKSWGANPTAGDSPITLNIQYRIAKFI